MSKLTYKEYENLFKNNPKYNKASIRTAWAKGKSQQWRYPNSTDIHSLQFIRDIDSYLIKYMSKSEQNKGIEGRLWGASHSLSKIDGAVAIVDTNISAELTKIYTSGLARFYSGTYYTIAFCDIIAIKRLGCDLIFNMYIEFLIKHFKIESS